jgi:hypothetical protein
MEMDRFHSKHSVFCWTSMSKQTHKLTKDSVYYEYIIFLVQDLGGHKVTVNNFVIKNITTMI